jgi:hypothetical protein
MSDQGKEVKEEANDNSSTNEANSVQEEQQEEVKNEGYTPFFHEIPYTTATAAAATSAIYNGEYLNDNEEGAMFTFGTEAVQVEDGFHYGMIGQDNDDDDDDYDETQPHEETFYADGSTEQIMKEMQQEVEEELEEQTNDEDFDFSLLAEQALQSLEMEYTQTLQSEPPQQQLLEQTHDILTTGNQDNKHNDNAKHEIDHRSKEDSDPNPPPPTPAPTAIKPKQMPDIDINMNAAAVTKAMQNIALSAPNLDQKLSNWKPSHPSYTTLTIPSHHPIIPSKPLLAFKRHTAKAKSAAANLTRSATLAESFRRLYLSKANREMIPTLTQKQGQIQDRGIPSNNHVHCQDEIFVIHCVGADRVECQTIDTIRKAFSPFVKWIHQYQHFEHGMGTGGDANKDGRGQNVPYAEKNSDTGTRSMHSGDGEEGALSFAWPRHVRIELLGPNIPPHAETFGVLNLLPDVPGRLRSATVVCRNCMYHDYLQGLEDENSLKGNVNGNGIGNHYESMKFPNLVIAYNAGIWGYTDWHPTLKKLYEFSRSVPFVITAYTLPEAEDDFEVLEEVLGVSLMEPVSLLGGGDGGGGSSMSDSVSARCLWSAELNPYASRVVRETKSSDNTYFENGAWQAYVMGKIR